MSQQRRAWRSCQKKHRKPIVKENIHKIKKTGKNQKIVFSFFTTSTSLKLVLILLVTH